MFSSARCVTKSEARHDGLRPSHERFPTWSSDGVQIAFFWHREPPTSGITAGFNEGAIYLMNADGTHVRNLPANYDVTRTWDDPAQIGDISPRLGSSPPALTIPRGPASTRDT